MAQNLDLRCVLISDPSTLGAGAKTRLHTPKAVTYHEQSHYCGFMIGHSLGRMESRLKKFTPHCICRPHESWVETPRTAPTPSSVVATRSSQSAQTLWNGTPEHRSRHGTRLTRPPNRHRQKPTQAGRGPSTIMRGSNGPAWWQATTQNVLSCIWSRHSLMCVLGIGFSTRRRCGSAKRSLRTSGRPISVTLARRSRLAIQLYQAFVPLRCAHRYFAVCNHIFCFRG